MRIWLNEYIIESAPIPLRKGRGLKMIWLSDCIFDHISSKSFVYFLPVLRVFFTVAAEIASRSHTELCLCLYYSDSLPITSRASCNCERHFAIGLFGRICPTVPRTSTRRICEATNRRSKLRIYGSFEHSLSSLEASPSLSARKDIQRRAVHDFGSVNAPEGP